MAAKCPSTTINLRGFHYVAGKQRNIAQSKKKDQTGQVSRVGPGSSAGPKSFAEVIVEGTLSTV